MNRCRTRLWCRARAREVPHMLLVALCTCGAVHKCVRVRSAGTDHKSCVWTAVWVWRRLRLRTPVLPAVLRQRERRWHSTHRLGGCRAYHRVAQAMCTSVCPPQGLSNAAVDQNPHRPIAIRLGGQPCMHAKYMLDTCCYIHRRVATACTGLEQSLLGRFGLACHMSHFTPWCCDKGSTGKARARSATCPLSESAVPRCYAQARLPRLH